VDAALSSGDSSLEPWPGALFSVSVCSTGRRFSVGGWETREGGGDGRCGLIRGSSLSH